MFRGTLPFRHRAVAPSPSEVNTLLGRYKHLLVHRPILGGFVTGAILWFSGDGFAQVVEGKFDAARLAGSTCFGSVFAGAGASIWYRELEHLVAVRWRLTPGSWRFVAAKLALEFSIWHPVSLITYWLTVGTIEGHAIKQTTQEIRNEFVPTIATEYALWAPLDFVNFWRVPVKYQVAIVNLGSLVESTLLSYIHEHGFPDVFGNGAQTTQPSVAIACPSRYLDKPSRIVAVQRAIRPQLIASRFGRMSPNLTSAIERDWTTLTARKLDYAAVSAASRGESCLPGLNNDALSQTCALLLLRKLNSGEQSISKDEYIRFVRAVFDNGLRVTLLAEACFALFDANGDGLLDEPELITLLQVVSGHDALTAKELVQPLRLGAEPLRVSKKEFLSAFRNVNL